MPRGRILVVVRSGARRTSADVLEAGRSDASEFAWFKALALSPSPKGTEEAAVEAHPATKTAKLMATPARFR